MRFTNYRSIDVRHIDRHFIKLLNTQNNSLKYVIKCHTLLHCSSPHISQSIQPYLRLPHRCRTLCPLLLSLPRHLHCNSSSPRYTHLASLSIHHTMHRLRQYQWRSKGPLFRLIHHITPRTLRMLLLRLLIPPHNTLLCQSTRHHLDFHQHDQLHLLALDQRLDSSSMHEKYRPQHLILYRQIYPYGRYGEDGRKNTV